MITNDVDVIATNTPRFFTAISLSRKARQKICVSFVDRQGRSLDLSSIEPVKADICNDDCEDEVDDEDDGFEDGLVPKEDPDTKIRLRAVPAHGQPPLFDVEGNIIDYRKGKVVFNINQKQTKDIGVFIGEIGLFRGDYLMSRTGVYINIEPSVFDMGYKGDGMITIPEVRLALRDSIPEENSLLDDLEFTDVEILACMRKPIDLWNSLLPATAHYAFNLQNFPFRYWWLKATVACLLEIAEINYMRNQLTYRAGGITVDDKDKWRQYGAKAKYIMDEFTNWAINTKTAMSYSSIGGHIVSSYYG